MNNGDKPATAITIELGEMASAQARATGNKVDALVYLGLTKREHFAGLAMQGLLFGRQVNVGDLAKEALAAADALLAALEKS